MQRTLATGLVLTSAFGLGLADEEIDPILNEESSGSGAQVDPGHGFGSGDLDGYIESWVFVSIPDAGTYTLREVLEEGSDGWAALAAYGEPIESYEPVNVFTPNVSMNNLGLVVLMPAIVCLGDFNSDGAVDAEDLVIFAGLFIEGNILADLTGDGVLDMADQFLFFELAVAGCQGA